MGAGVRPFAGERREEGFLAKTFHEIERAVGGIGGGAAAVIGGRAATRSITSTTQSENRLRHLEIDPRTAVSLPFPFQQQTNTFENTPDL